jgi:hypothetical protein
MNYFHYITLLSKIKWIFHLDVLILGFHTDSIEEKCGINLQY